MKKKATNNITALVLAILLCLSILPFSAMAAPEDTYTVTFYAGTSVHSKQTIGEGDFATEPSTPSSPAGYGAFLGWTLEDGGAFSFATPIMADTKVYAKFEDITPEPSPSPQPSPSPEPLPAPATIYDVVFVSNGETIETKQVEGDNTCPQPQEPTPDVGQGAFLGWYIANSDTKFEFTQTITGNLVLVARFADDPASENYVVRFVSEEDSSAVLSTVVVAANGIVSEPSQPTIPAGKVSFKGWYMLGNTTEQYNFSTPVTKNITLVARFSDKYLVAFSNGYGQIIHSEEISPNGKVTKPTDLAISSNEEDEVFRGTWLYDNGSEMVPYNFATEVNSSFTLYPQFLKTYYVHFYSGGSAVPAQLIDENAVATEPSAPSLKGYAFLYWSTDDPSTLGEGETPAEFAFTTPITRTTYLYAVWEELKVNYTVVYWLEKPNMADDFDKNDIDNYNFSFSETRQEYAGRQASVTSANATYSSNMAYAGFYRSTQPFVAGDGTTVVNVFYTRNVYTLILDLAPGTSSAGTYDATMKFNGQTYRNSEYTITAKVEEDITDRWPVLGVSAEFLRTYTPAGQTDPSTTYSFMGWLNSYQNVYWVSKRFTFTKDMVTNTANGSVTTVTARWVEDGYDVMLNYMFEALDQENPSADAVLYGGIYYENSAKFTQGVFQEGTRFSLKTIDGMTEAFGTYALKTSGESYASIGTSEICLDQYLFYNRLRFNLGFDLQGGEMSNDANQANVPFETPLSAPEDPTKEGFRFDGWYRDADFKTKYDFTDATMPAHNLTLFAKWESTDNKVTFLNKENGDNVGVAYVPDGGFVEQAPESCRYIIGNGYEGLGTFLGWYWYASGQTIATRYAWQNEVKGDFSLFGRWQTDGFTITYTKPVDVNGAVPTDSNEYDVNGVKAQVKDKGELNKANSVFAGWLALDAESNPGKEVYYPGNIIGMTSNMKFLARFLSKTEAMDVRFYANYPNAINYEPVTNWTVAKGDNITMPAAASLGYSQGRYTFEGWATFPGATSPDASLAVGSTYIVNGSQSFYAVWKKIPEYTVMFITNNSAYGQLEVNGALQDSYSVDSILQDTAFGDAISAIPTPKAKDNYYFAGWVGKTGSGGSITPFPSTVATNQTYTAQFLPKVVVNVHLDVQPHVAYNAQTQTASYTADQFQTDALPAGYKITGVKASGSGRDQGVYDITFSDTSKAHVLDASGKDITEQYTLYFTSSAMLTIDRAPVTINVASTTKVFGTADPAFSGSISGNIYNNELGAISYHRAAGEESKQSLGDRVVLTASYTNNDNYAITVNNGAMTIIASGALGVSANNVNVTYDANSYSILASATIAGSEIRYGTSAGNYTLTSSPMFSEAGTYTVYFAATANGYETARGSATVTINRRPITIRANSASFVADGTEKSARGYTQNGLLSFQSINNLSPAASATAAGEYPVTLNNRFDIVNARGNSVKANYAVTLINGLLRITDATTPAVDDGNENASGEAGANTSAPTVDVDPDTTPTGVLQGDKWALLNLLLAAASVLLAIYLFIRMFKRNNKETAQNEQGESESAKKLGWLWRVIGILLGILAPIVFFLTENMRNQMQFVDAWTILMVVILLVQGVFAWMSKNKKQDDENKNTLPEQA